MKERRPRTAWSARRVLKSLLWIVGLVVVVLVILRVVFSIHFGFFKTTLSLKPTAMTLEDVKAIEHLITAEYFGEVIGTARDYFVRRAIPETERLLLRLMNEPRPETAALSPAEESLLDAVRATLVKRAGMSPRIAERVVERSGALDMIKPDIRNNHLDPAFADSLLEVLLAKRDIAYLARGTVQAGYDLSGLDETKFFRCRETGIAALAIEPTILAKDINPWFIYDPASQNYVKGFEIIAQSGIDLEEDDALEFLKSVKEECRQRLLEDALRTGLRERARTSAEETLTTIFRMFDPGMRSVRLTGREEFDGLKASCADRK